MILPPPHRATFSAGTGNSGPIGGDGTARITARDAVAEIVRVTLLDDTSRRDRREDLAFRAHARRLGFLTQALVEITPPEPVPTRHTDPMTPLAAARYRATLDLTAGAHGRTGTFRTELSA